MSVVDIVVDLCWGDCAKGKVAFHLLKEKNEHSKPYTCVAFSSGGPNRGHVVYHNNEKFNLHQIPCGVLLNKMSIIGAGCVINVDKLLQEAQELEIKNISVYKNLKIAYNAHIITQDMLEEDKGGGIIGSTSQGIMQAYRAKYGRIGIRAESIKKLQPYLIDTLEEFYNKGHSILVEGSQGTNLCPDWGDKYPFVTSGIPSSTYALHSLGLNAKSIHKIIGCIKSYSTYSGFRDDFEKGNEEDKKIYEQIANIGQEIGNTTKRKRKICWNDMKLLKRAVNLNGCDVIVVSKMDILQSLNVWKVFDLKGEKIKFNSEDSYKNYLIENLFDWGVKDIRFSSSPYEI